MNVTVMCCVLNEESNIERYCEVYLRFVDRILICDGGSTDRTVELAKGFPKTTVVHFDESIDFDGHMWNPLGKMHNFAYEAATKHDPDWLITDECDSIPTWALQQTARWEMKTPGADIIGVPRIYIVGEDKYYPKLSFVGLWGWAHRPKRINGRYWEGNHKALRRPELTLDTRFWHKLEKPFGLLHYGWPNEEVIKRKTEVKRASGSLPPYGTPIPTNAGETLELPEWARWN